MFKNCSLLPLAILAFLFSFPLPASRGFVFHSTALFLQGVEEEWAANCNFHDRENYPCNLHYVPQKIFQTRLWNQLYAKKLIFGSPWRWSRTHAKHDETFTGTSLHSLSSVSPFFPSSSSLSSPVPAFFSPSPVPVSFLSLLLFLSFSSPFCSFCLVPRLKP